LNNYPNSDPKTFAMAQQELIPAEDLILHYNVEFSFIRSLGENGLLEIHFVENKIFVPVEQLHKLEKMVRLHHELEINPEGIEAISHILERVISMQDEIRFLKNRLRIYEGE
jgi:hypothetical protein